MTVPSESNSISSTPAGARCASGTQVPAACACQENIIPSRIGIHRDQPPNRTILRRASPFIPEFVMLVMD